MIQNDIIYGRPIQEWDKEWKHVGLLSKENIFPYKGQIGLYRIFYGENKLYIGKATEIGDIKGIYKRLNDYIRDNDSGRKSIVAQEIHRDLKNATFDILLVGKDKEAVFAVAYLEQFFIDKYKPNGNTHGNLIN